MNRQILLTHGTQMRECVLNVYRHYPHDDANEIVRRMLYEIGECVSDLHGRKDAAQLLLAASDAVTAKLPIEDFRLPAVAAPAPEPQPTVPVQPGPKTWKDMNSAQRVGHSAGVVWQTIWDRGFIGFWLGVWAGRSSA